jgi:hypothetical protein
MSLSLGKIEVAFLSTCTTGSYDARGTYLLRRRDRVTTVIELNAIARPASSGLKVIPKIGYSAPAASGTRMIL